MQYRKYGKSDILVSALGYGTMRLPEIKSDKETYPNQKQINKLISYAYENGINYYDCAYGYLNKKCEEAVGEALLPYRKNIYISTKLPLWYVKKAEDFDTLINEQLKRLKTDYIDFYHFHAVNKEFWKNTILKLNLIDKMQKYKREGKIRFISFSYHDDIETMKEMIDTGIFSTCLCQYNLIDRSYEEGIKYAAEKGMGVAIMGPVGGGRLEKGNEKLNKFLKDENDTLPKTAFKFVLSNPHVSTVLSGMGNMEMLKENIETVNNFRPLSKEENEMLLSVSDEFKKMSDLYCTGCKYCLPCTKEIDIPGLFKTMNKHIVYGLTEQAKSEYKDYKNMIKGSPASICIKCKKCLQKCPQKINIIERLDEIESTLG